MTQSLALVEARIEKVLSQLERLKQENAILVIENKKLKADLAGIRRGYDKARLSQADQTVAFKSRLSQVLERIEQLEALTT